MNELKDIRQRFFALRNGVLADAVRKAGCPAPRIFGLNVPQIARIAREYAPSPALARELWAEKECRESRLLACYLFDTAQLSVGDCLALVRDIQSVEEADMLAFRMLKRHPQASAILQSVVSLAEDTGNPLHAYAAGILRRHLS